METETVEAPLTLYPLDDALLTCALIDSASEDVLGRGRPIPTGAEEIADPLQRLAWTWLQRAKWHTLEKVDAYLRGDVTKPQPARAVLKLVAEGLAEASGYLLAAAHRLRDRGDAHGASLTHERSVEVRKLYEELGGIEVEEEADPDPSRDAMRGSL